MAATKQDIQELLTIVESLSETVHELHIKAGGSNFDLGDYWTMIKSMKDRINSELESEA